jgi:serine protease inhibitor
MNRKDLYEGIGHIDNDILERSEQNKKKNRRHHIPIWFGTVAAILVLAVVGGILLRPGSGPLVAGAHAIAEASYPEMVPYPDIMDYANLETGEVDYEAYSEVNAQWFESVRALWPEEGYAEGLDPFFARSIQEFLSGHEGENIAYSPLNVYMALGMLAELTGTDSRQQILDTLGVDNIESLRTQATALWKSHYRNDGATTSILASSLWLNEDVSFVPETMETLAETYYASSFQGEMGSQEFNQMLQNWLNTQTGGLLENQIQNIEMTPDTILALATTVNYQAKWIDEFQESDTTSGIFHGTNGDLNCSFMHDSRPGTYFWGDRFGAVYKGLGNDGGVMWFLLPAEGTTAEELLEDPQVMDFLLDGWTWTQGSNWDNCKNLIINLSLPKFDISSQIDLREGMQALGITNVFDGALSDFSPMTENMDGIFLSQTQHGVRVTVDEQGVAAAAYTVMTGAGASEPPEDEVDFVLDRPFLFAITSRDNLPLFVGIVNQPA